MTQHNIGKVPGPFPLRSEKKNVHVVTHLLMIKPGFLRNDLLTTTEAAEFTLPGLVLVSIISQLLRRRRLENPSTEATGEIAWQHRDLGHVVSQCNGCHLLIILNPCPLITSLIKST